VLIQIKKPARAGGYCEPLRGAVRPVTGRSMPAAAAGVLRTARRGTVR